MAKKGIPPSQWNAQRRLQNLWKTRVKGGGERQAVPQTIFASSPAQRTFRGQMNRIGLVISQQACQHFEWPYRQINACIARTRASAKQPWVYDHHLVSTRLQLLHQFQTGPIACLRTMQAAYPHLKRSGAGRVINFASSVGVIGAAGFAPYAMAKEAIRALSRVAAREWGADAGALAADAERLQRQGRTVSWLLRRDGKRAVALGLLTSGQASE